MRVIAHGITKSFSRTLVLDDVSIEFESGCINVLVAPSGSGKTTLLSILAGLERPDGGSVAHEVGGHPMPVDPGNVAWVTQGNNVLAGRSVLDNVLLGPLASGVPFDAATKRALDVLDHVGLRRRAIERARALSGGELQRLCLARALASPRRAIFADEPTAHLDEGNTSAFAAALRGVDSSTTILIATHDPVLVDVADRVFDLRAKRWVRQ